MYHRSEQPPAFSGVPAAHSHIPGMSKLKPPARSMPSEAFMPPPPPFMPPHALGPRERDMLFSDPIVQNAAKELILTQLREDTRQATLRSALLEEQVKLAQVQTAQAQANLEITRSGLPQELIKLQMEAAAVQARKAEAQADDQSTITQVTASHMRKDEAQRRVTDEEYERTTRHTLFS